MEIHGGPLAAELREDLTMLVLKRKEGQWIEVTHRSGDRLRIRVTQIRADQKTPMLNMAFDDDARHFEIRRSECNTPPKLNGRETRTAPRSSGTLLHVALVGGEDNDDEEDLGFLSTP